MHICTVQRLEIQQVKIPMDFRFRIMNFYFFYAYNYVLYNGMPREVTYFEVIIIIIILRHFFLRHISDHCGHSEARYSIKCLQIIS